MLGKLLKYVGENNVVWGTDSIWYGSPQEQIESFLQFRLRRGFSAVGYPALTMEIKRKILGLNAARIYGIDPAAMRCAVAERARPAETGSRRRLRQRPLDVQSSRPPDPPELLEQLRGSPG